MVKTALAAAVALAFGTGWALAGTPATRLPGEGAVVNGAGGGSAVASLNAAGNQMTIALGGNTVIDWGGGAAGSALNPSGAPGFDVGSRATVNFTGDYGVLNVDVTGNPSEIDGALTGQGSIFVANQNGIIVGPMASIASTSGMVGLIANSLGTFTFDGTQGSIVYTGSGGNAAVQRGAGIAGSSVLIAGGGTVNVDVGGIAAPGTITLQAGLPAAVSAGAADADPTASVASAGSSDPAIVLGNRPVTVKGLTTLASNPAAASSRVAASASRWLAAASVLVAAPGNPNVTVTGSNPGDVVLQSAGNAGTAGNLSLDAASTVAGTLRNTGTLALAPGFGTDAYGDLLVNAMVNAGTVDAAGAVFGSLANYGAFDGGTGPLIIAGALTNPGRLTDVGSLTAFGNVTNSGTLDAAGDLTLDDGNLTNFGKLSVSNVFTVNGAVTNYGQLSLTDADNEDIQISRLEVGAPFIVTTSDATDPAFRPGSDDSVTNNGSIVNASPYGLLLIDANDSQYLLSQINAQGYAGANGSTGSFLNRGNVAIGMPGSDPLAVSEPANPRLFIYANNNITLGGSLPYSDGTAPRASAQATTGMGAVFLNSGGPNGTITVATPIIGSEGVNFLGNQIAIDANILDSFGGVISVGNPPTGFQGFNPANSYSLYIAPGVAVAGAPAPATASTISIEGIDLPDGSSAQPSVFIGGTIASNTIQFQGSNLYAGPSGEIVATGSNPLVTMQFTGNVGAAPSPFGGAQNPLQNDLPIVDAGQAANGSTPPVTLVLNPAAYFFVTSGTPAGVPLNSSSADILVDGSVNFIQNPYAAPIAAGGSAAVGSSNAPNIPLTLQATGNITTQYTSYWPGAVSFGTIAAGARGAPLPGTLGSGTISLGGSFSNVLPGNVAGNDGIAFLTAFPLAIPAGATVTTNANADILFGTAALAQGYANGLLSPNTFYGGVVGANGIVTYGPLAPSRFGVEGAKPSR